MGRDDFWNNRDQAQKLIDEANSIRKKIDPLLKAEKQLEDFKVMLELGEAEPPEVQAQIEEELQRDLNQLFRDIETTELKVFLTGPHAPGRSGRSDRVSQQGERGVVEVAAAGALLQTHVGAAGARVAQGVEAAAQLAAAWMFEVQHELFECGAGIAAVVESGQGQHGTRLALARDTDLEAVADQFGEGEACRCQHLAGGRGGTRRE